MWWAPAARSGEAPAFTLVRAYVEPPAGIEPATPSLPFVWSRSIEARAQVNVTRVTVSDRQAPPVPAPYGTQLARPVSLKPGCQDEGDQRRTRLDPRTPVRQSVAVGPDTTGTGPADRGAAGAVRAELLRIDLATICELAACS